MTIEEIKELIRVVHETGIAELEVQRGENRVRIRSVANQTTQDILVHHSPAVSPATLATPAGIVPPPLTANPPPPVAEPTEEATTVVKSPIVGTYYDAPSPGAPEFVKVGDQVEPGKVLCIIESMKLMNEIEAEIAGTIVAKLVENGKPVEYGESLFTIRLR
jgi:acetyl-CoA carboxylase biotin carboxyl carrier protein